MIFTHYRAYIFSKHAERAYCHFIFKEGEDSHIIATPRRALVALRDAEAMISLSAIWRASEPMEFNAAHAAAGYICSRPGRLRVIELIR